MTVYNKQQLIEKIQDGTFADLSEDSKIEALKILSNDKKYAELEDNWESSWEDSWNSSEC